MSLTLLPLIKPAIRSGLTYPFNGTSGTPPYVYSVVPGGIGGTIDSGTGIYTAPSIQGIDTIKVTDSLAATATQTVLVGNILELFCDVIQKGMGLADGRVYLWDQKINAPTDSDPFIAISVMSSKPFGNSRVFDPNGNEIQSVNMHSTLSVDIISRGPSARDRKEEVIMALNSFYSEQQQEMNSFKIFTISSSFVNISEIDGAAIPYRFNISVNIQYFVEKTNAVPFFDDFSQPDQLVDA